jgi:hypothetical protein
MVGSSSIRSVVFVFLSTPALGALACGGTAAPEATAGDAGHDGVATSGDSAGGADSQSTAESGSGNDAGQHPDSGAAEAGAGDGGLSPACPASTPTDGSACTTASLACEYGNDLLMQCDTIATCDGKVWHVQPPTNTGCGGSTGGTDPGCPATSGAVPVGQACSPQMTCGYANTVCYCYIDHTGAPQIWGCFPATSGCPFPRPRLGSTCTTNGLQCDYSSCMDSIACNGGIWGIGNGGCHP